MKIILNGQETEVDEGKFGKMKLRHLAIVLSRATLTTR